MNCKGCQNYKPSKPTELERLARRINDLLEVKPSLKFLRIGKDTRDELTLYAADKESIEESSLVYTLWAEGFYK